MYGNTYRNHQYSIFFDSVFGITYLDVLFYDTADVSDEIL